MAANKVLTQREADIQMMLAADVHLGTKNCDFQMERYVFKRRSDGIFIINLGKTWEKLQLAARIIVAIENPQDIIVQSARPYGQRAILKFAQYTGAQAIGVDEIRNGSAGETSICRGKEIILLSLGEEKMAANKVLTQREADIQMMLAADVHLGTKNCDFQMERYVFKRRSDGIFIINLGKTWEKLQLAARIIVAIENPQDIIVQSARPYGQRAILKFAQYTGAQAIGVDEIRNGSAGETSICRGKEIILLSLGEEKMAANKVLTQREADIQMMLAADVHLGTKNCDFQMERYVFKRRSDGIFIINLGKTWEKLQLAARIIVAIENPQDIIVQSARPYGQRAILKFAQYTGAQAIGVDEIRNGSAGETSICRGKEIILLSLGEEKMAANKVLTQREADIQMMLAADVHLGTKNCDFQMERYVFKRRSDGIFIINLGKTWEKLQLAARIIVAIENPQDIIVQSARPYGQRAILKFAQYTGAQAIGVDEIRNGSAGETSICRGKEIILLSLGEEKMAANKVLTQREADIQMMLAADVHLGTKNCDFQMERYVFKRRSDGIFIINLGKTWEKLQLAARIIVAIENPQDIIVQSARPYGQRAILKFAQYTGAQAIGVDEIRNGSAGETSICRGKEIILLSLGEEKMAANKVLTQREADIQMMLAADVHLGTKNCDFQMERYVFKRRSDGIFIINLGKTWEKLQLAARIIVAIENPQDIIVQSARPYGQRAILKFAQYTGAQAIGVDEIRNGSAGETSICRGKEIILLSLGEEKNGSQ